MPTAPFDESRAHRWFAVEFNNLAWDLLEKPDRTAEDDERLRHAAHAACLHWQATGSVLNDLRAHVLLTTTYAHLGPGRIGTALCATHFAVERTGRSRTNILRPRHSSGQRRPRDAHSRTNRAGSTAASTSLEAAQSLTQTGDREVFERFYGTLPVRNAST
jgi:hypothetical protein